MRLWLSEADKSRFINPVWDVIEKDPEDVLDYTSLKKLPNRSDVIKWVNSGAADKYRIDWSKFDPKKKQNWDYSDVAEEIIQPFLDYQSDKQKKADPKNMFSNKEDFLILDENSHYLFVGLKTYEAAHFCDSFQCGGAGAKWCIGYDRQYWSFYNIKEESRFVLAYSKKRYGDMNDQKYMIEILQSGSCKVWSQVDRVKFKSTAIEKTCEYFSITEQDLLNWYSKLYGSTPFDTVRSVSMNQVFEGQVIKIDDSAKDVVLTDFDTQPSFEYANLCQGVKFGKNSRVLRVDGEGGVLRLEKLILGAKAYSEQAIVQKSLITDFVITNYSKVVIPELIFSAFLSS